MIEATGSANSSERSSLNRCTMSRSETIPSMELATGVPLVYRLKPDSTVASKDVLTA